MTKPIGANTAPKGTGDIHVDEPAHASEAPGTTPSSQTDPPPQNTPPGHSFGVPPAPKRVQSLWQRASSTVEQLRDEVTHRIEDLRDEGKAVAGHAWDMAQGYGQAAVHAVVDTAVYVGEQAKVMAFDAAHAALCDQPAQNDIAKTARTIHSEARKGIAKAAGGAERASAKLAEYAARPIGRHEAHHKPTDTDFMDDLNHIAVGGAEAVQATKPITVPLAGVALAAGGVPLGLLTPIAAGEKVQESAQAMQIGDYTGAGAALFGVTTVIAGSVAVKLLKERNALRSQLHQEQSAFKAYKENERLEARPRPRQEAWAAEAQADLQLRNAKHGVDGRRLNAEQLQPLKHRQQAAFNYRVGSDYRDNIKEMHTKPANLPVHLDADAIALRQARLLIQAYDREQAGSVYEARAALAAYRLKHPGAFPNTEAGEQAAKLKSKLDALDGKKD